MSNNPQSALQGCVRSLQASMQLMESSLDVLDAGMNDFPRLTKVLQATRHFELISEKSLHAAQQSVLSTIEPELNHLLERVESHLDHMARREQSLMAKTELQQGRLQNSRQSYRPDSAQPTSGPPSSELEALKLEQMRQKKQRLSYAVGRLELQANQRERQLRKSMAVMHGD